MQAAYTFLRPLEELRGELHFCYPFHEGYANESYGPSVMNFIPIVDIFTF